MWSRWEADRPSRPASRPHLCQPIWNATITSAEHSGPPNRGTSHSIADPMNLISGRYQRTRGQTGTSQRRWRRLWPERAPSISPAP
jgi:hypothetical protein